jgi:hypothetical protein
MSLFCPTCPLLHHQHNSTVLGWTRTRELENYSSPGFFFPQGFLEFNEGDLILSKNNHTHILLLESRLPSTSYRQPKGVCRTVCISYVFAIRLVPLSSHVTSITSCFDDFRLCSFKLFFHLLCHNIVSIFHSAEKSAEFQKILC